MSFVTLKEIGEFDKDYETLKHRVSILQDDLARLRDWVGKNVNQAQPEPPPKPWFETFAHHCGDGFGAVVSVVPLLIFGLLTLAVCVTHTNNCQERIAQHRAEEAKWQAVERGGKQ